jgi:hypothetical protein
MRSPYETKIILLLKATTLAGALAARHECPGARPFPSAPTQRLFLCLATREVLIGGLPAGERDLTGVVIRRQQVLLLAGSVHPVAGSQHVLWRACWRDWERRRVHLDASRRGAEHRRVEVREGHLGLGRGDAMVLYMRGRGRR